jgi:L-fuculose-phosphate aldolase
MDLTPQELISYIGKCLFDRKLTDYCGGNISMRVDRTMYITPRYSGARQHWKVDPATILSGSIHDNEILSNKDFSREGRSHIQIYRNFPDAAAIIHAHPFHVLPFCATGQSIPPVLESTEKFGVVEAIPFAPSHSQELADCITSNLAGKESFIKKHAAVLLLPKHGLIAVSKDLYLCLDAVERINTNAWCLLAQKMLPD